MKTPEMKRPALLFLLCATTSTIFSSFAISAAISTISDSFGNPTAQNSTLTSTGASATVSTIPNGGNLIIRGPQASLNTSADQTASSSNSKQPSSQATSRVAQFKQQGATKQQPTARRQQAAIGGNKQQQRSNDELRVSSGGQRSRPSNSGGPQANVDPLALAQQQARLMMGYNNTPPLFVTRTRDLFVDVARYSLGIKLTTMKAVDIDGDHLEYSLQPANLHDASPYFSIDSISGELRLANKPFQFHQGHNQSSSIETGSAFDKDSDDDSSDSEDGQDSQADETSDDDGQSSSSSAAVANTDDELMNRNLYFLNVAADDGRYTSVVELQIHVINSSSLAGLQSLTGGLPVQLTPEESKRASERMESIIRKKTKEFYDKLNKVSPVAKTQVSNSTIVYPNFVNPSLIRPTTEDISGLQSLPTVNTQLNQEELNRASSNHVKASKQAQQRNMGSNSTPRAVEMNHLLISIDEHSQSSPQDQQPIKQSTVVGSLLSKTSAEPSVQSFDTLIPQPILVSLVVFCSCLTIALVSLAFLIPSTMRKLRKELKHVERQHGQLSQQASIGSSTVCSSSSSMVTHNHDSSLSQFTLNSDRSCAARGGLTSAVCRQNSLDSTLTVVSPQRSILVPNQPLSRVNNGSIANPVYLDQPRQQLQLQQPQQYHLFTAHQANINQLQQQRVIVNSNNLSNHYYPLDDNDEFYSTINTESTVLGGCLNRQQQQPTFDREPLKLDSNSHNYFMANCAPPPPPAQKAEACDSDAFESTNIMSPDSLTLPNRSSLARFLSLPMRHSALQQAVTSAQSTNNSYIEEQLIDLNDNNSARFSNNSAWAHHHQAASPKTIARSSNISREQQSIGLQTDKWELERHNLKFLELLGEGQFGLVFRCNLRQDPSSDGGSKEQVAAVKTLKVSVSREARGREEFLAEIEIMKLVCNHPNVVKILHCCTKDVQIDDEKQATLGGKPILLVMEYAELGKLQSLLERSRMNHDYTTSSQYSNNSEPTATNDRLTSRDLVKFIYHVAKGMEYIASQCIVHRDIASRNILVSSQRICKIGDFGMARHMQSLTSVYERHSLNTKIPVRWMAPEVLLNNKFTTKSDVFSFGILMWEIVTLGSTPYTHLKTEQVIDRVARNGERPIKPEYCHAQLYQIMSKCWSHEPDERPTFRSLAKQFDELLLSANNYIELDEYPNHNYYNILKTSAPYELL